MIARVRKSIDEKDQGFTLIELLVVIIIIGILSAIAIPVFLNQRKKAVDASVKSDLRTVANEFETYFTDKQVYPTVAAGTGSITIGAAPDPVTTVKLSPGNIFTPSTTAATGTFCFVISNPNGTATTGFAYDSDDGGVQKDDSCV
ncbi:prepilin-type N-terminal cleavage/methylation domain-containing protein [Cellulomonas sp. Sa3CUA2]|uniref:Prepilin-type N-terminal cleavage/methylation domain-containing protein n=1 Tax=Cellulomonas avistercoris TaxID=2762242 RepID=A0ABR8Q8T1_9CELL|nr:prepilin-type N-terminal cleavage/methylation domain-containing protein [Cellulomonas avistercoris]MBD7916835.1 prepilin-type N-terminal cleavage/methylation domain-containing protein [Cellulomonas avistercoris]